jgi:hypothetical protein
MAKANGQCFHRKPVTFALNQNSRHPHETSM